MSAMIETVPLDQAAARIAGENEAALQRAVAQNFKTASQERIFESLACHGVALKKNMVCIREDKMMYDYIIVGAGSAGCVLANRLTENPGTSVLLIEAGGNDDMETIHNPTRFLELLGSAVDWAYFTEEEPHLGNRKIFWPRGRVLGGSSSINWLMHVRGNRSDYDHWQELKIQVGATETCCPLSRRPRTMKAALLTIAAL